MTHAGCRIKSVRPKGKGAELVLFRSQAQLMDDSERRDVVRIIKQCLDNIDAPLAGFAFVAWDNKLASSARLATTDGGIIPVIALPDFIKNRLMGEKILDWMREE